MQVSATCAIGLERVLASELERFGLTTGARSAGRVSAQADRHTLASALAGLRTADRLFLLAGSFPAADFDQLFEGVRAIPWELWVGKNDKLVIEKAKSSRSAVAAQNAIQAMSLKAAYERLCPRYGVSRMPETGALVSARVRIEDDKAVVELDLCGEALSRRGYRKHPTEAPLKESVAAALLYSAGWRYNTALYDPFCGSGTIPIEAALMGLNVAPGLLREFAWESMPDGGRSELIEVREKARSAIRTDRDLQISGSDADKSALESALANARLARVDDRVRFFQARAELAAPFTDKGMVITDPPYGKRLGTPAEADALYASLSSFRDRFKGWELCFVVDREDFSSFPGSKGSSLKIIDGSETRFFHRFARGS